MTDPTPSTPVAGPARRAAAALTLLEGLVLIGFTAFYVYEMGAGATDDLTRAATSGVLILVFAVALLALARGWARGADWPRTPTLLWNALLLPVAWSLQQSGRTEVALPVAAVAVASIVAALKVPGRTEASEATGATDDAAGGVGGEDDGQERAAGSR